jgi:hypothetical protein
VELSNDDEALCKLGALRAKEKLDSSMENIKGAPSSDKLDLVFRLDLDLVGLNGFNEESNGIFRQALASFLTKDWAQALELFSKLPKDQVAKKYVEMIQELKEPPEDWDGSFDANQFLLQEINPHEI